MWRLLFVVMTAVAYGGLGCGGSRGPAQSPIARLKSTDADERQEAADELRDDGKPSPDATRALLEAIAVEKDERAYGAMLISLGASGAPEAEGIICEKVYADSARMRAWAKRAQKMYLERNRESKGCPPPGGVVTAGQPSAGTGTGTGTGELGTPIGPKE
jgi:hypothetical protein